MRPFIPLTSLMVALVGSAASLSPVCAQTSDFTFSNAQTSGSSSSVQNTAAQKEGTDLIGSLLGVSLLMSFFHSGSSSGSSPSFSSGGPTSAGSTASGVGVVSGSRIPQGGGSLTTPPPGTFPNSAPVPESSTAVSFSIMLLLGGGGLGLASRCRRMKAAPPL